MANTCLQCSNVCGAAAFCPRCQAALLERSRQQNKRLATPPTSLTKLSPSSSDEDKARKNTSLLQKKFWSDLLVTVPEEVDVSFGSRLTRPMLHISGVSSLASLRLAQKHISRLRCIFLLLAALTVLALLVDGGLLSLVMIRYQQRTPLVSMPPMITLTPAVVHLGQVAQVHISHFPATSHVLLTRDIGASVRLDQASSLVTLDGHGEVGVRVLVDRSWGIGTHYIDVEDVASHYTASTVIHIVSIGQEPPPHLMLTEQSFNLGDDYVGANTLQQVLLQNTGGGDISWTAQANQPWLSFAPAQGIFSVQQPLTLAVSRAHLIPGSYQGMITFYSNAGSVLHVQVAMHVRAWPEHVGGVLSVEPVATSLSGIDSGADPAGEDLTVSNPGTKPLYWSVNALTPTFASDQNVPLDTRTRWLVVQPASGEITPGMTETVHIQAHTHMLLPGNYSEVLSFTGNADIVNMPQPVVVALTIQPRCGPALTVTDSVLTGYAGPGDQARQNIGVSLPATCSEKLNWTAMSLTSWLTISPDHGELREHMTLRSSLAADSTHLRPGTYAGTVLFVSDQRTQTLAVQFTVFAQRSRGPSLRDQGGQSPTHGTTHAANTSPTGEPVAGPGQQASGVTPVAGTGDVNGDGTTTQIEGTALLVASPVSVAVHVSQGQAAPAQTITFSNPSAVPFYWQAMVDTPELLSLSQSNGILVAGQTTQVTVQSITSSLDVGTYTAHIVLSGSDITGHAVTRSPQSIVVTVNVRQPCMLQVTPPSLSFTATLLDPVPATQQVHLSTTGDCAGPVTWSSTIDTYSNGWLSMPITSGNVDANGVDVDVATDGSGHLIGLKRGQITFSASDSNGNAIASGSSVVQVTLSSYPET